jgi:hypothetical protein
VSTPGLIKRENTCVSILSEEIEIEREEILCCTKGNVKWQNLSRHSEIGIAAKRIPTTDIHRRSAHLIALKLRSRHLKMSNIHMSYLAKSLHFLPPYSLVPLVYLSVYPRLPSSAAL